MNKYNREELIEMFGYSFQIFKAVSDLNKAISAEQNKAYNKIMGNYDELKNINVNLKMYKSGNLKMYNFTH